MLRRYLGLWLALLALGLFAYIATHVLSENWLTEWDRTVAATLHPLALHSKDNHGWMVPLLRFCTTLANHDTLTILGVGIFVGLLMRRQYWLAFAFLGITLGGELLNLAVKSHFARERPVFDVPVIPRPHSWSFPSGHAMGAIINYGALMYLLCVPTTAPEFRRVLFGLMTVAVGGYVLHRRLEGQPPEPWEVCYSLGGCLLVAMPWQRGVRLGFLVALALLILAVGFSRFYLGVHWFSDVLGGFLAGGAWLAVGLFGCEVYRQKRAPEAAGNEPVAAAPETV
ncbi:MAG: phosphatase PAP2 family protein [Planctomycetia bacterium]|nr:phosphatase PAP2 family protein [Planctomycetia bacterium]